MAFHRGVAAYGEGRFFEAEREFITVIEEDPEDRAALGYLGLIAQGQGEFGDAISYFERSLAIDPSDTDVRLNLVSALLEAGRNLEADVQLATVRAQRPGDPYGLHYSGVAAYRAGRYAEALRHFENALAREPKLALRGRYYIGLCETFLRNTEAALGAFAAVEEESPTHPLARSASELRTAMRPEAVQRRWALSATAGVEYDSNPLGIGERSAGSVDTIDEDGDVRGVFSVAGQVRPVDTPVRMLLGYNGYLSLHADQSQVDQQTHLLWLSGSTPVGPVRLGWRGDVSWSAIDLTDSFRWLYRSIPTVTIPTGDWGVAQLFYEFQFNDFESGNANSPAEQAIQDVTERTGLRHTVGFDQFAFFDGFLKAVRGGAAYSQYDARGPEFEHLGFEISVGGTLDLGPVDLRALYRFQYRDYENVSSAPFASAPFAPGEALKKREDRAHRIVLDLVIPVTSQLEAVLFGRVTFNGSNVPFYDYDRQVGGLNLTWRF